MKIILEREKCIGCGSCQSICPKYFKLVEDGKSSLVGGKRNGSNDELEIKEAGCTKEAADSCPVQCIHIQ